MTHHAEINLLPLDFRQRAALRRGIGIWALLTAAAAGVCAVEISREYYAHAAHRQRVAALRTATEPVEVALETQASLRQQHQELGVKRRQIEGLLPSDDLLQTLGAVATLAVDDDAPATRIQALQIDLRGAKRRGAPKNKDVSSAPSAASASHIRMTAVAGDEVSLHQWIGRLRQHERFRDVRLRGTAQGDAAGGRRVEIEAEVSVEKELPQ